MTASKKSKPLTDMLWDKIYTDSYSSLIFLLNLFANFLFRAIKKAECWRTDAFELWCWTLESPLDCKEIQLWILKESSPEYSLEGLMRKLQLQHFGHLMRRTDSLEKTLKWKRVKAGGVVDDRGWDGWMASLTCWTWVWASSGSWWWTRKPGLFSLPSASTLSSLSLLSLFSSAWT